MKSVKPAVLAFLLLCADSAYANNSMSFERHLVHWHLGALAATTLYLLWIGRHGEAHWFSSFVLAFMINGFAAVAAIALHAVFGLPAWSGYLFVTVPACVYIAKQVRGE